LFGLFAHPGERDGLPEHIGIADMIGKDEHQLGDEPGVRAG